MDKSASDKNPLVSICTTFFNAGRYIHRVIESCLNQTYKNIEIVIVDDASTDDSERVVREYMARDSRVKYFRNDKRANVLNSKGFVAEGFLKMSKLAKGDFAMMMGADDWLARDYIENGVRAFLRHPDIAGVVPDLTALFEHGDNGIFTFDCREHFSPGTRSAEWFIRRIYRPTHLYISGFALVRSKDFVSAMEYFVENYYHNPSKSVPEELREFFRRAFGIDSVLFTEVLTRYKSFIFDNSLNYIKIAHSDNSYIPLKQNSLSEVFKKSYYYFLIYKYIYKLKWPRFYPKMKIFMGAQVLSASFIGFFQCGFRLSFLNIKESKKLIYDFFGELSFFEITMAVIYSVSMTLGRCFDFVVRKFTKTNVGKSFVFTQENFLDSEGRFKANG
ncbi:MAG: glycosyltransferase family 2 protein [bacterium]|nr:glycosyltransferase family 2 protein [bacterium]